MTAARKKDRRGGAKPPSSSDEIDISRKMGFTLEDLLISYPNILHLTKFTLCDPNALISSSYLRLLHDFYSVHCTEMMKFD